MARVQALLAIAVLSGSLQAQNMVRGEYWIDLDQGFGANTPFTLNSSNQVAGLQLPITLTGLQPGTHTIGIRTLDADGRWGLTNFTTAVVTEVPDAPPASLTKIEYFVDEDPSFGSGTTAWAGSTTDAASVTFAPDLSGVEPGAHTLFVRSIMADGKWGLTNSTPILVTAPDVTGEMVHAEAFNVTAGPDPGFGSAVPFTIADPQVVFSGTLTSDEELPIEGNATLAIRGLDSNGKWSLTNFIMVIITNLNDLASSFAISTYPNPFTEGITVRTDDGQPVRVVLYDPQGRLVHDKMLNGDGYIDLSQHASGTYTAFFWKELERIHRVQLVKQ